MEHKASPRRRAGAGDRQGVRELGGEQRSLLERSLSAAVPICSCAPAGKDVSLRKSPFSFAQAFAGACALVPSYEGGVSTPESWGSGRVFSGSQARRGRGSREVSQDGERPRTLSLCLPRHAALANLLRSAILWHKEMHMAASDAWRPLHPAFGFSQKMGMIPGDSVGFYTPTCRNSSVRNESPVSKFRGVSPPSISHSTFPPGWVTSGHKVVAGLPLTFHLPLPSFPCLPFRGVQNVLRHPHRVIPSPVLRLQDALCPLNCLYRFRGRISRL